MRTPITYYGGKQQMLEHILPMIPKHKIYCEVEFGGGALFFAKPPSYLEVINDTNDRLINFYQVMQSNFNELNYLIENTLHCETEYYRAKDIYNGRITGSKTELAWAVWVITNMSFAGSMHGGWKWCNGSAGSHTGRFIRKKRDEFKLLKNRLNDVQICNRDEISVISDRDTPDTFFYLDPPYPGFTQQHYSGYTMKKFSLLLERLETVKGKFILSNFWSQTLKYHIIKNKWNYKKIRKANKVANFNNPKYKTEILIWNFELPADLFSKQVEKSLQFEFQEKI